MPYAMTSALREAHPWPNTRPDFPTVEWVLDGGGKELISARIATDRPFLVIEVGAFMGASVRRWLAVSPYVEVIAVDPWDDEDWWGDYAEQNGRMREAEQFRRSDGPHMSFLSTMWEYRDRLTVVQGRSPGKLREIASFGVRPDLIYFDSDKVGGDIEVAHELWPSAIITGDDWTWGQAEGYPIREPVRKFARARGLKIVASKATWAVTSRRTARDRVANWESLARDLVRAVRAAR